MQISSRIYQSNRRTLVQGNGYPLCVLTANSLVQRSNDMAFKFQQESNFLYLSGIEDPDWLLIIDAVEDKSWLVAPFVDEVHRVFDGGLSIENAKTISGVDEVILHDELESLLRRLAKKHSIAYTLGKHPYSDHFNFIENPAQKKISLILKRIFNSVHDCRSALAKQRAIKQDYELSLIKEAVARTIDGFANVKQKFNSFRYEYEIEADFDLAFKRRAANHAYDPIVASGLNACTLHYVANASKLRKRSLVLLDVGASVNGYAADISRTYAYDEPTKRQGLVHESVQAAHRRIIALLKPDLVVDQYLREAEAIMSDALKELNLYKDETSLRRYFPHAISHGLGIDVHDSLGAPRYFKENMVLTVEPGIYIPEENIGVRIEDDILITATGSKNLSANLSTGL